jgi:hypothetical protein
MWLAPNSLSSGGFSSFCTFGKLARFYGVFVYRYFASYLSDCCFSLSPLYQWWFSPLLFKSALLFIYLSLDAWRAFATTSVLESPHTIAL